jgi:hypothetical protein
MFKNFTVQIGRIKNYRKDFKDFKERLLKVTDIKLYTYKIEAEIFYRKTVPLNIFEKYILRILEKSEELGDEVGIEEISKILFVDKNLIERNLENLEGVGFVKNLRVNRDENAEYLQFENKFKVEKLRNDKKYFHTFHITQEERENLEEYLQKKLEKDQKLERVEISRENESFKTVQLLLFENGVHWLNGKNGINQTEDLKFLEDISKYFLNLPIPKENFFCHKEEFPALIRDKFVSLKDEKTRIFISGNFDKTGLEILKTSKLFEKMVFVLTNTEDLQKQVEKKAEKRIFLLEEKPILEEFVLIGNDIYFQEDDFIYCYPNPEEDFRVLSFTKEVKRELEERIGDFDFQKEREIEQKIKGIGVLKTQKELDSEIGEIGLKINKLLGVKNSKERKKIDLADHENGDEVVELKKIQENLQEEKKSLGKQEIEKESLKKDLEKLYPTTEVKESLKLLKELESF